MLPALVLAMLAVTAIMYVLIVLVSVGR